jgi:phage terminase small subunit
MSEGRLTDKQRVFIEHYLATWNATRAAEAAGYKDPEQAGYENKKKQEIQDAIRERLAEKTMSADEVLARLTEHARGSLAPFLRFEKGLKPGFDFNQESARANLHLIKRYSIGKGGAVTIELYDAQAALTTLAKHHGLLVDKGELNGSLTIRIVDESTDDPND